MPTTASWTWLAIFLSGAACAQSELPTGAHTDCATLTYAEHALTITQTTPSCIIDWSSFNIGAGNLVEFVQGSGDRVLNRVDVGAMSLIAGIMRGGGAVYLVNPGGVMFTSSALVDVSRLYAAAGHMSNDDFDAGHDRFTDPSGVVRNDGLIRAVEAHLLGARVQNHGVIASGNGVVTMLAARDEIVLSRLGDRIHVRLDGVDLETGSVPGASGSSVGQAAVENHGIVAAGRGQVVFGAGDLHSLAVRNSGLVQGGRVAITGTSSGVAHDGEIIAEDLTMSGASIRLSGEIHGESVRFADDVVVEGDLQVSGVNGAADLVQFDESIEGEQNAALSIDAASTVVQGDVGLAGGLRSLTASGDVDLAGDAQVTDGFGVGGDLRLVGNGGQFVTAGGITVGGDAIKLGGGGLNMTATTIAIDGSVSSNADARFDGATSIGGDVTVGDDAIFFGDANVGGDVNAVGDADFRAAASIGGSVSAGKDVLVAGTASIGGGVSAGRDVEFTGNATVGGDVTAGDDLRADGALDVGGAIDALGDVVIGGTASVAGDIHAGDDVEIGGTATVGGALSAVDDVTIGGVAAIGGDLVAGGDVTFSSDAVVGGAMTVGDDVLASGDLELGGGAEIGDDLMVLGDFASGGDVFAGDDIDALGDFAASGDVEVGDDLTVTGDLTAGGDVLAPDDVTVGGNAIIDGSVVTGDDLTVNGTAVIGGAGDIGGDAEFFDDAELGGDFVIGDDIVAHREIVLGGSLEAGDRVSLDGDVTLNGAGDQSIRAGGTLRLRGDTRKTTGGALELSSAEAIIISGALVESLGDLRLNPDEVIVIPFVASISGTGNLTLRSVNGDVLVGPGEKITALGNLTIDAAGTATLGDLTALGDITVDASQILIRLREAGVILIDGGDFMLDAGVDVVAGGRLRFTVTPTFIGTGPAARFASGRADGDVFGTLAGIGLLVREAVTLDELRTSGFVLDLIADGAARMDVTSALTAWTVSPLPEGADGGRGELDVELDQAGDSQ